MKKILFAVMVTVAVMIVAVPTSAFAFAQSAPDTDSDFNVGSVTSRSSYMLDYDTGTVILDRNSDERYPIASMVKIMTLLMTFNEIDGGSLTLEEYVTVSDCAAGMGGSQMFLDAGCEYTVSDLIKGVTVCSANDAAVALAERICGSVESFVSRMNAYAKEIGMENTLFVNPTGLPNSGEQYSTAKDVSIMFRKLLAKEKYYQFSGIWLENYTHPDGRVTEMVNTNKLIRFYKDCDAGKTGYTDAAKHCLAASAKRDGMRVIGVILGAENSKARFKEMTDMFNYSFANYGIKTLIKAGESIPNDIKVENSKEESLDIYVDRDIKFFARKNAPDTNDVQIEIADSIKAPISKETPLGTVKVVGKDGEIICEGKIYSRHDVEKLKFKDALEKVLRKWLSKK